MIRRSSPAPALAIAAFLAALPLAPAAAASLIVRDADGSQWMVIEDPMSDVDEYQLRRVGPDRKPDPRFGRSGKTGFTLGPDNDTPTSVRVDIQHRTWTVGSSMSGNQPQPVVVRFNPDGSPDTRWGVQGKQQMSPSGLAVRPNDLLPLADGSLLVAGDLSTQGVPKAVVYHLRPDGLLDSSFGTRGIFTRPGNEPASATSLAVGPDGSVVLGVSVRGAKPAGEVWALNDAPPALLAHDALDDTADEEEMRAQFTDGRWALSGNGGPTSVVPPASLARRIATAAPVVTSSPMDSGQGGFSPFAAEAPAAPAPAPAPVDDGVPWLWIGVIAALALGVVGVFLRGRTAPATPIRSGGRR